MRIFYFFISFFSFFFISNAQVGIGTTSPNPSSVLDVTSLNKGVLLPRVALTGTSDTSTISSPAEGLIVYNNVTTSDVTPGFYYWNGSIWTRFVSGAASSSVSGWSLTGNNISLAPSSFLGTISSDPLTIRVNNNEIGKLSPNGSVSLGRTSSANSNNSFAMGFGATTNNSSNSAIAMGYGATIEDSHNTIALGYNASVENGSTSATAIGYEASVDNSVNSLALGYMASVLNNAQAAMALGYRAQAENVNSIAIGYQARTYNASTNSLAIGYNAFTTGYSSLALGYRAAVTNDSYEALALGFQADAGSYRSIALGYNAETTGYSSIAIGHRAAVSSNSAENLAIGFQADVASDRSIVIGYQAKTLVTADRSISIGYQSQASGNRAHAVGYEADAIGDDSIAIGYQSQTNGTNSISFGRSSSSTNSNSIALGTNTAANNQNAIAIGNGSTSTGLNSVAIGNNVAVANSNTIAIGDNTGNIRVGIGTYVPQESLHIDGSLRYVDGNQGVGKVLVSDANGSASWQIKTRFAEIYKSTSASSQNLSSSQPILFGSTVYNEGFSYISSNYIRVSISGYYRVSYSVSLNKTSGGSASQVGVVLSKASSTSGAINGTYNYLTLNPNERETITGENIVHLNTNEQIYLYSFNSLTNVTVLPGSANLNIELLKAD